MRLHTKIQIPSQIDKKMKKATDITKLMECYWPNAVTALFDLNAKL